MGALEVKLPDDNFHPGERQMDRPPCPTRFQSTQTSASHRQSEADSSGTFSSRETVLTSAAAGCHAYVTFSNNSNDEHCYIIDQPTTQTPKRFKYQPQKPRAAGMGALGLQGRLREYNDNELGEPRCGGPCIREKGKEVANGQQSEARGTPVPAAPSPAKGVAPANLPHPPAQALSTIIDAHTGSLTVNTWTTKPDWAFDENLDTFTERFDAFVKACQVSKAMIVNMLSTNMITRVALDPCGELNAKEAFQANNDRRGRTARANNTTAVSQPPRQPDPMQSEGDVSVGGEKNNQQSAYPPAEWFQF
ncbi:hypothetical protein B0T16DRAFT_394122 [Cercophora newfieldiana]|uniref:Uncharacterized protein n=1 Tax=Cercophora newfieldiana TaxID=92897 RepID=A0AA39XZ08_9PEZI|nr:hypothetical protein B0T16DRAFT_394122 [Cercophora newfieldiana]